jgi:putative Mn2+ efflux pump MntP
VFAFRDEPDYARAYKAGRTMSDISINITWWDLIIFSPVLGWPGAILGGILGVLLWRKRPILGGAIGALIGNFSLFAARIYMM